VNYIPLILVLASAIFVCRISGFTLKISRPSPFWEQFLRFVPISLFAAIATSSFAKDGSFVGARLIALVIAGGVTWYTKHFALGILVGMLTLWGLMFVGVG
jgi:branched-subunit amino acid transport protein